MFKKDRFLLGFVPASVLPIILAYGYYVYLVNKHLLSGGTSFKGFFAVSLQFGMLSSLLSLGCLMNLALVFIFTQYNKIKASRGVITATIIYAAIVVYLKFIR